MYVPEITICLVSIIIIMVGRWFFLDVFILLGKVSTVDYFHTVLATIDKDKKF